MNTDDGPRVFVAGYTVPFDLGIQGYLAQIGAERYYLDTLRFHEHPAEWPIVLAGKLCYRSWSPEFNPNVEMTRDNVAEYIANIISKRDGSVLEHVTIQFFLHNVSRVLTHELVRHRVGTAISQESLRYMRLTKLHIWLPKMAGLVPDYVWNLIMAEMNYGLKHIETGLQILDDWMAKSKLNFTKKKIITSLIRRFIPMGIGTEMFWSANLRTLRWIIEQRTAVEAEAEIREVVDQIALIVQQICPTVMFDFVRDEDGVWTPKYSKI